MILGLIKRSSLEKLFKRSVPSFLLQWWLFSFSPNCSTIIFALTNIFAPTNIYGMTSVLQTDQKGKRHLCYWIYCGPFTSLSWHESHFIIIAHLLYGQSSLVYSNLCEERVVTVYLIAFSEPSMVPGMHCTHNKIFVEWIEEGRMHERSFQRLTCLKSLYIFFLLRRCNTLCKDYSCWLI